MTYVHLMEAFGTLGGGGKSDISKPPTPLSPPSTSSSTFMRWWTCSVCISRFLDRAR